MVMDTETSLEKILGDTSRALSAPENIKNVCHLRWHGEPLPSQAGVKKIVELTRSVIFPGFFGESDVTRSNIGYRVGLNVEALYQLLKCQIASGICFNYHCDDDLPIKKIEQEAGELATRLTKRLPELRRLLEDDARAIYRADPAATGVEEVIYCYPGLRAVSSYRLAHELHEMGVPVIPRMISEIAHSETGADIHPAAKIGERFMIDHCTGVVIGATTIIGNDVRLYQGVTLGAKSFVTDADNNPVKGLPRHPILGNGVVVYANATILGRVNIGDGAVIGGNVWLTRSVAPGERVVQATASETAVK